MRVKPTPRTTQVAALAGQRHAELAARCPEERPVLPEAPCTNESCPWRIQSTHYMNCAFMAFAAVAKARDSFSLEEVGDMLGITREGVRQIELRAIHRLRCRMRAKKML